MIRIIVEGEISEQKEGVVECMLGGRTGLPIILSRDQVMQLLFGSARKEKAPKPESIKRRKRRKAAKKPGRKPGLAKTKGVSKSEFIRSFPANADAGKVVDAAKEKGMKIEKQLVWQVQYSMRKKKGAPKKAAAG